MKGGNEATIQINVHAEPVWFCSGIVAAPGTQHLGCF